MSQVVLVVGGSGGIGSAITQYFSEQGAKTFFTYFKNEERAREVKNNLTNCEMIQCDIRNEADVNAAISKVIETDSKVDVLVYCVTNPLKLKTFDRLALRECLEDIEVILYGGILLAKAVLPHMKERRSGTILNLLTSAISGTPPARMSSYVIAKYGLLGLTKSLASEVDRFNIKVLGLSPTFVETSLLKNFPAKLLEIEKEKQADGSLLQPEDIACATWQLVQNVDKYKNGENVQIQTKNDIFEMEVLAKKTDQ